MHSLASACCIAHELASSRAALLTRPTLLAMPANDDPTLTQSGVAPPRLMKQTLELRTSRSAAITEQPGDNDCWYHVGTSGLRSFDTSSTQRRRRACWPSAKPRRTSSAPRPQGTSRPRLGSRLDGYAYLPWSAACMACDMRLMCKACNLTGLTFFTLPVYLARRRCTLDLTLCFNLFPFSCIRHRRLLVWTPL